MLQVLRRPHCFARTQLLDVGFAPNYTISDGRSLSEFCVAPKSADFLSKLGSESAFAFGRSLSARASAHSCRWRPGSQTWPQKMSRLVGCRADFRVFVYQKSWSKQKQAFGPKVPGGTLTHSP